MKKSLTISAFLLLLITGIAAQESLVSPVAIANETAGFYEGFTRSSGKNDFTYHSFRTEVNKCMLTRCTNGQMGIEWQTAFLPTLSPEQKGAGFTWIAAMDLTPEQRRFTVALNGIQRFVIESGTALVREINSPDGGSLKFFTMETDQHGDAHGYMTLWAPRSWLIPGKEQTISITGEAAGVSVWIIVYQAGDAANHLQQSVKFNAWLNLEARPVKNGFDVRLSAPGFKAGSALDILFGNKKEQLNLTLNQGSAVASFFLPAAIKNKPLTLLENGIKIISQDKFGMPGVSTRLIPQSVLYQEAVLDGSSIRIKARREYKPETVNKLVQLAESPVPGGQIYLMNSSHQDIAWMDSPERCVIERDTMLLTPLFEKGSKDPNYRFDLEDALMVREYVQRHPDRMETVRNMFQNGRISCGATLIQPYEDMYSGEALVRQLYFGAGWLEEHFSYKANTYWNVDVPGRTLQMPQILSKAGVRYMVISRHEKGIFNWFSPDGSFVTAFSPGHYGDAYLPLHRNFFDAAQFLAKEALHWQPYFGETSNSPIIPLLSDWDMSPANDYSHIIRPWEEIRELEKADGKVIQADLPKFKTVLAPEFFRDFTEKASGLPAIKGERPNVWLYIHGPTHHKAISASREGDILLTMAEKFATANALLNRSFLKYPAERLANAWAAKIYPDHGWGGKNGQITDDLFLEKYQFARNEARAILDLQLTELASSVKVKTGAGIPLVVFNSLSWERTDPVTLTLPPSPGGVRNFRVTDESGHDVPTQVSLAFGEANSPIEVKFTATGVPSIGYKTFYLHPESGTTPPLPQDWQGQTFENGFYRITFAKGGIKSIFDKALNKELLRTDKFLGAEVITLRSVGTGAGEFADIQQPDMDGFDKTSLHAGDWVMMESGPVCSAWKYRSPIRHAVIELTFRAYHQVKRLDIEVAMLNWEPVLYREFRLVWPLDLPEGKVSYEAPFGMVTVGEDEIPGAAGERYTTPCKDIHPRSIENWISCNDRAYGVTLSSSVAVADWIDPTDDPVNYPILQPILLASRRSCHEEGNEYLQEGDHHFHFSLTSHLPGRENSIKPGKQANESLMPIFAPRPYVDANLPETMSFFSTDADNLIISTVKKAESGNSYVTRIYETNGVSKEAVLSTFLPVVKSWQANLLETPVKENQVSKNAIKVSMGSYSIETFRLSPFTE